MNPLKAYRDANPLPAILAELPSDYRYNPVYVIDKNGNVYHVSGCDDQCDRIRGMLLEPIVKCVDGCLITGLMVRVPYDDVVRVVSRDEVITAVESVSAEHYDKDNDNESDANRMNVNELRCYGFFGSIKVAYFAANDKTGVPMADWTIEHVEAIRKFAANHDDDSTREWASELINEWQANYAPQAQEQTILYVISCAETRYPQLKRTLATMGITIINASAQCQIADTIVRITRSQANELYMFGYHVSEV
jgi:hypothetical protein